MRLFEENFKSLINLTWEKNWLIWPFETGYNLGEDDML